LVKTTKIGIQYETICRFLDVSAKDFIDILSFLALIFRKQRKFL